MKRRHWVAAIAGILAGAMMLYTFVVTPSLFANVPDRAARSQFLAAVFPNYFRVTAALAAALAALAAGTYRSLVRPRTGAGAATLSVLFLVFNWAVAGPRVRELSLRLVQAAEDPAVRHEFGLWHGISSGANLAALTGVVVVLAVALVEPRRDTGA